MSEVASASKAKLLKEKARLRARLTLQKPKVVAPVAIAILAVSGYGIFWAGQQSVLNDKQRIATKQANVLAQVSKQSGASSTQETSVAGATTARRFIVGTITDVKGKSIVITDKDQKEQNITVTDQTTFVANNGKSISLSSLKKGKRASVMASEDDQGNISALQVFSTN